MDRRAPRDPIVLVPRRLRTAHYDFLAGGGIQADEEVLRHPKQAVEDGRLDRRIIEAIPAGLVDRHARIEEEMEPTRRPDVDDLEAGALRACDEIPRTENMEVAGRVGPGPGRGGKRMPPALRIRREDVQQTMRLQRATGDGEACDRGEGVLDDVARRDHNPPGW